MKFTSVAAVLVTAVCFAQTALAGSPASSLRVGSNGPAVTQLEQNLHANQRMDLYGGTFDGDFGPLTRAGLRSWQKLAGYPVTGSITVGSRQWNQLRREATVSRLAGYISRSAISAARSEGWAVDASKAPGVVSVLHYDPATSLVVVTLSISAAYGGYKADDGITHNTTNGVFRIQAEYGPDFVSHLYNNAPMPYAACFNGGQCLHYDGLYPSHGCIHIPSMSAAIYINRLPLGTTVVVHG
jgi:hypothetical protein